MSSSIKCDSKAPHLPGLAAGALRGDGNTATPPHHRASSGMKGFYGFSTATKVGGVMAKKSHPSAMVHFGGLPVPPGDWYHTHRKRSPAEQWHEEYISLANPLDGNWEVSKTTGNKVYNKPHAWVGWGRTLHDQGHVDCTINGSRLLAWL